MLNWLTGKKTYLVSFGMLINAGVMALDQDYNGAITMAFEALGMAGLRSGISTHGINPLEKF